jgi:hypothetical protein
MKSAIPNVARSHRFLYSPVKQLSISTWILIVLLWYFHQFAPVFQPILRKFTARLWP